MDAPTANRFADAAKCAIACIDCHHYFRAIFNLWRHARYDLGAVARRDEILLNLCEGLKENWRLNAKHARSLTEDSHKRFLHSELLASISAANHQREHVWKFAGDSYSEDRVCFPTAHALALHAIHRVWHVLSNHSLFDAPPSFSTPAAWPRIEGMDRQLGVLADEEHAKVAIGAERQSAFGLPPEPPANALTKNEFAVLHHLAQKSPQLCTLDDLEVGCQTNRRTAIQCLRSLIKGGFACRPAGERKGATVTEVGKIIGRAL